MSHVEFEPQPSLQRDIKAFWTLEEAQEVYNSDDILPDSYVELVINVGAPLVLETERSTPVDLPRVFLKGLQQKPLRLRATGLAQIVGIRLYAWSALLWLNLPMNASDTPITPVDGIWQDLARLLERTVRRNGYTETVDTLHQFVSDIRRQEPLQPIETAGALLYATRGQMRMTDLAARSRLSLSQLERRFKQITGVSPKTLARLIRFETLRNDLFCNPDHRSVELAGELGYNDQAHLIHEFKTFAARTPGELIGQMYLQDAEFLQYP